MAPGGTTEEDQMRQRVPTNSGRSDLGGSEPRTTRLNLAAAAVVLLLGGSAIAFATLGSTEALATAASILISVGLIGLLVMACVLAARLARPGGDGGGGGPGGGRPGPVPIPTGDPDAELLRLLDDARLRDDVLTRRAPLRGAA
jgi:hypothetical protein